MNTETQHQHFAGRFPAGTAQPVIIKKEGAVHTRRMPNGTEQDVLAVGLACSECFSGTNLAKILQPGFDYESRVMQQLTRGEAADPLSIHTSAGVTSALGKFVEALRPHIPWNDADDNWCVSLQLEGASAVWAAIDMLLQVQMVRSGNKRRTKVAVGATSYHGPPSTSFGSATHLWTKVHQVTYPVPLVGIQPNDDDLKAEFDAFLDKHSDDVGVIIFEPQWGSSQAALPWPPALLRRFITKSKEKGIMVLADEIMCGLGRHGKGTLFVSKAWELEPDAVTFGKAIGGGVYPLSGTILKVDHAFLVSNGLSVMQSHTFSGSSVRALLTATAVLDEISHWLPHVARLGEEMEHIFGHLSKLSDGLLICHGQGLMWGGVFTSNGLCQDQQYRSCAISSFKAACDQVGILPYFVPRGGFMVTPLFDVTIETLYTMAGRLEEAIRITLAEIHWNSHFTHVEQISTEVPIKNPTKISQETQQACQTLFHVTQTAECCQRLTTS